MPGAVRYGRGIAVFALGLLYALLAHYTNITPGNEKLGAAVALAPIVAAALAMAWQSHHQFLSLAGVSAVCLLLVVAWGRLQHNFNYIYLFEHAGSQLILCTVFWRTLRQGSEPMCTYFAKIVHGSITPDIETYTRQVTIAWTIFFGSMACASLLLFFTLPLASWSAFAYFFTAPLIGLMFVAEYAARKLRYPQMQHAHLFATIAAVWKQQSKPSAGRN